MKLMFILQGKYFLENGPLPLSSIATFIIIFWTKFQHETTCLPANHMKTARMPNQAAMSQENNNNKCCHIFAVTGVVKGNFSIKANDLYNTPHGTDFKQFS